MSAAIRFRLLGAVDQRGELAPGRRHVVGPGDAGGLLDRLGDREEGDPLAVGKAAALQDGGAVDGAGQELQHEPGLADPGRPEEREQVRRPFGHRALERPLQQVELPFPPDHRRVQATGVPRGRAAQLHEPERRDRFGLALEIERGDGVDVDGIPDEAVGRLAEQDLAGLRGLLEPRGDVHGVARDQALAGRGVPGDDLPGVHADPRGQLDPVVALELGVQLGEGVVHAGRGDDGSERVVLVQPREAEHRHHGVADELLDGPLVGLDHGGHPVEVAGHHAAEGLGVEPLTERGGLGHVGEDDRDDPSGLGRGLVGFRERGGAALTEPGSVRVLLAAGGAALHG